MTTRRHPHHLPARARVLRRATVVGAVLGAVTLAGAATPVLAASPGTVPVAVASAGRAAASATVSVTGTGRASAAPDLAVLSVAVEEQGKTAKEAMEAQNRSAKKLLDALRKQSVEDRDIRTDGLSVSRVYAQSADGESKVSGYVASQSFTAKVRDVDRAGSVIGAVTEAAGNAGRVNGVSFDVADRKGLRSRAREVAYQDAYDKAVQHARLSGHRLGRLVSLSETEGSGGGPGAVPEMPSDAPGVPLAPGEIEEQVTLTAVYELI
ncbi:SIMPL domain-containing protein [Streptomyces sp. NPDC090127]|uniref:SIMPL domain-containing protein n=1 Tax=Streptomyces sp. NPDC090127 TaxID=3365953 RepID=UPI0037F69B2E